MEEEEHHQHRDLSCCYYGLREHPKKKTLKSLGSESMKKVLFRCVECGKGFRYEKCLANHQAVMHQRVCEESVQSLCSSFSLVRKKKRSSRYKKKTPPLSCSFTNKLLGSISVSAENDVELEVAECLILLSKSSPKLKLVSQATNVNTEKPNDCLSCKKPRKGGEFESGFLRNDQKLMKETWKDPESFLVGRKGGDFELGFYRTERGDEAMECYVSDTEMVITETEDEKKNFENHQCRLCNKVFSSYQALGGHQTCHRSSKSKNKKNCKEKAVEEETEDESVTVENEDKRHKCSICSKGFRSVHALGGHKKCHGKEITLEKTEYDH